MKFYKEVIDDNWDVPIYALQTHCDVTFLIDFYPIFSHIFTEKGNNDYNFPVIMQETTLFQFTFISQFVFSEIKKKMFLRKTEIGIAEDFSNCLFYVVFGYKRVEYQF